VPVIAIGRIHDPGRAEQILADGRADFIAMGRPLLADPDLPRKLASGQAHRIRKCISCENCIDAMDARGVHLSGQRRRLDHQHARVLEHGRDDLRKGRVSNRDPRLLAGRGAVVVGGSRGIGAAVAIPLATQDLFAEQAIADTTLADIADRSGVTVQTILRRFGVKSAVFAEAIAPVGAEVQDSAGPGDAQCSPPPTDICGSSPSAVLTSHASPAPVRPDVFGHRVRRYAIKTQKPSPTPPHHLTLMTHRAGR